jgi:hypothetical protein
MARQKITPPIYQAALDFYRLQPGSCEACAAALGISLQMATRIWRGTPPHYAPWMKCAKEALDLKQIEANRIDEELRVAEQQRLADMQAKREALIAEANEIEDNILRGARQDVAGGLVILSNVVPGLLKLMADVNVQLERGTDAKGQPIQLDAFDVMKLVRQFSMSTRALVEAGTDLVQLSRLQNNEPTQIFGHQLAGITLDDAEREITAAAEALARAKARGAKRLDDPTRGLLPEKKVH